MDHGDAVGPQASAVAEADEEAIGGFVLVNWDDDDGDGVMDPAGSWTAEPVPDLEEASVTGEDNLAKLVAKIQPIPLAGSAELEIVEGADKIKLWSTRTKGTEVLPGASLRVWNLSDPTERDEFQQLASDGVWVEGTAPSDAEREQPFEATPCNGSGSVRWVRFTRPFHRLIHILGGSRLRAHYQYGVVSENWPGSVSLPRDTEDNKVVARRLVGYDLPMTFVGHVTRRRSM